MTEHELGDVVGTFANKVQIHVPDEHADLTNSYRTISSRDSLDGVTVTVEAGKTFFRYEGERFMFDGVTYHPNSDHRDDEDPLTDGEVDMVFPDGFQPEAGHRFNPLTGNFTLSDFAEMLKNGDIQPTGNPHEVHD